MQCSGNCNGEGKKRSDAQIERKERTSQTQSDEGNEKKERVTVWVMVCCPDDLQELVKYMGGCHIEGLGQVCSPLRAIFDAHGNGNKDGPCTLIQIYMH